MKKSDDPFNPRYSFVYRKNYWYSFKLPLKVILWVKDTGKLRLSVQDRKFLLIRV